MDKLQDIAAVNSEAEKVVNCFIAFNEVKNKCFGHDLSPDFKDALEKFESSYNRLEISVTPKVHADTDHVIHFIEHQGQGHGLGKHSEQASEAVHNDFIHLWKEAGYKRQISNTGYYDALLKCVVTYNSRHI